MPRKIQYDCDGMRPLTSNTVNGALAAARIFANRIAQQTYGPRGKFLHIEPVADGRSASDPAGQHEYVATIGSTLGGQQTVTLTVMQSYLPRLSRARAVAEARENAERTGTEYIAFRLDGYWEVMPAHAFPFSPDKKGLTAILRFRPSREAVTAATE